MLRLIVTAMHKASFTYDLNTSHVKVNPKGIEREALKGSFKYISC